MLARRHLDPLEEKPVFLSGLKVIHIQLTDHLGTLDCVAGVKGRAPRVRCAEYEDKRRQAVAQPHEYVPHGFTNVSGLEKATFAVRGLGSEAPAHLDGGDERRGCPKMGLTRRSASSPTTDAPTSMPPAPPAATTPMARVMPMAAAAHDDGLRLRGVRSQGEAGGGEGAAQNSAHQSAAINRLHRCLSSCGGDNFVCAPWTRLRLSDELGSQATVLLL
jgi:hypothetical protein